MTTSAAAACPQCGEARTADTDFCVNCGAYLAWSDMPAGRPARRTAKHAAADPSKVADPVMLFVTVGTVVLQQGASPPLRIVVAPGATVDMVATIRNLSARVNSYTLSVENVPPDWVTIREPTVHLLPVGPQGDYERKLAISIRPPRSSAATFGPRDIAILATPESGRDVARVPAVLDIGPFEAIRLAARPTVTHGRRRAALRAEVHNGGNAPIIPLLSVKAGDERCRVEMPAQIAPIAPGQTVDVRVGVRAPLRLLGRPLDHELKLSASASETSEQTPAASVMFRQRALVPWWLPTAVVMLAALGIALYAVILANRRIAVPPLRGVSSAFAAQRLLQREGFTQAPLVKTRVVASEASGTVLDQAPEVGTKVRRDTVITLRVAVSPSTTIIPDLRGQPLKAADGLLTRAHLKLGAVVPSKDGSRRIRSQVPLPGSSRPRGTVVDLVVAGPGRVRVPVVRCLTVTRAEKRLTRVGLKVLNLATITTPGRRVRVQVPAAGELRPPGSAVQLVVDHAPKCSAADLKAAGVHVSTVAKVAGKGTPAAAVAPGAGATVAQEPPLTGLTFDDGHGVRSATSGQRLVRGRRPAWSPGGRRLATVRAGGLTVQPIGGGGASVRVLAEDGSVVAAAFAPGRPAPLVAFVTATPLGGALCLVRADHDAPDCLDLPGMVPRGVSWGQDAMTLYVVAAPVQDPAHPGLLVLHTPRPGSSAIADYDGGSRLLRPSSGGETGSIFALAQRPGSDVAAVVTDLSAGGQVGRPQVALVDAAQLGSLAGAHWLGRRGCQLTFNPEGTLLAIAAGAAPACPADPTVGRLTVVPLVAGLQSTVVTRHAASPAWNPEAARQP